MPEAKREHHPWGWPFVWLWLKICFLRVMSYIDVWCSDHLRPKPNEDVCVEKIRFPSRDKGRFLTAYVYTPKKLPSGPQPVHVNVHGSGFCVYAFFGNSRWFCYRLASSLNCVVIDTDYRKAPEHPYPFPPRDVEDCLYWVLSQPARFDKEMITMSGFSAGGNLAMTTANKLGPEVVKALVSYYAPIDATTEGASCGLRQFPEPAASARSGTHLVSWVFATFFSSYIPPQVSPSIPEISVLFLPMERYPNHMLVVSGRCDVMHEDSHDFYKRVQALGSPAQKAGTRFLSIPSEDHAFDEQPKTPESVQWRDTAYEASIATIRAAHEDERKKRAAHITT